MVWSPDCAYRVEYTSLHTCSSEFWFGNGRRRLERTDDGGQDALVSLYIAKSHDVAIHCMPRQNHTAVMQSLHSTAAAGVPMALSLVGCFWVHKAMSNISSTYRPVEVGLVNREQRRLLQTPRTNSMSHCVSHEPSVWPCSTHHSCSCPTEQLSRTQWLVVAHG